MHGRFQQTPTAIVQSPADARVSPWRPRSLADFLWGSSRPGERRRCFALEN